MLRIAVLSVHTCPLACLGGWETGGMNVYVRELSRELGKLGVATDVFTRRQDPELSTVVALGEHARVIHIDAGPPRHVDKYAVLDYLSEFACNVQRFRNFVGARYDLIHAHYWLSGRLATLFQEHWGVPAVAMFHTLAQMKNRVAQEAAELEQQIRVDIERRSMASADRVIAATDVDRAQMVAAYSANPRSIEVVPGGVDLTMFRPGSRQGARTALGLGSEPLLLFVGRVQRLKGIDVLLRAAAELDRDPVPDRAPLRLLIVGGTSPGLRGQVSEEEREMVRLRALAAELGLSGRVDWAGAIPQDQLPLYYRAADVTVIALTYEAFGVVAVESLACGTPVVASRVGGLTTIVREGNNGFLVPWRNPRLFADKIRAILADAQLRDTLGQGGIATARRYGWSAIAGRTLDVYDAVLARRASARASSAE